MSLKTLTEWMVLLCGTDRSFDEGELSVDVHGAGDASYLVFERDVSQSPRVSDQYVLHPLPGGNPLYQQVRFLAECEFDVRAVLIRLVEANYTATQMNEVARFESVEVARYRIRGN
jgi:hypothetical protein